jgi:hypothetical protein
VSVLDAESSSCLYRWAGRGRRVESRLQSQGQGGMRQNLISKLCHKARPEFSYSSRERRPSSSARSHFSSRGNRPALRPSCPNREPYTPWPVPQRTREAVVQLRIGVAASHKSAYARSSPTSNCLSACKSRKVHTGLMKFRGTWAGVLTAMMLFVSSAAASCEVKCDIGGLLHGCHSEAASRQANDAHTTSGMCHGMAGSESGADSALAVSSSSLCSHHVCAQQPATLTDQRSVLAHVPVLSGVVHWNVQHFEFELLASSFAGRGPPHFRPSSPVELHTIQRV